MLADLIQILTDKERQWLEQRIAENGSQLHQFIGAVLRQPDITKQALEKKFGINENTYFKNVSLARNEIYEAIRLNTITAYNELMLPSVLYKRGLEAESNKLRLKLQQEYDRQGWWTALNELYGYEMAVAYAKCDLKWMREVKEKVAALAPKMADYVVLDKELAIMMVQLEMGQAKDAQLPAIEQEIKRLSVRAAKLAHPVLLFNAHYCELQWFTNLALHPARAAKAAAAIEIFLEQHDASLFPLVRRVALLNLLSYHTQFESGEKPALVLEAVQEGLGKHNLLYDTQVYVNLCSFYLLLGKRTLFEKYKNALLKSTTDRSFGYQLAYVQALHAFQQGDAKQFYQFQNAFYAQGDSREYNNYNLMLRYFELVLLIRERGFDLALDKLEALTKFLKRNFSKARAEAEKIHLQLLRAAIQEQRLPQPKATVFRHTLFLWQALTASR
ncbi:MAG: hypothetical protein U0T84_07270 [Chitinophagales bacterium]